MFPNAPNPIKVQCRSRLDKSPPTPLVLIHDGSGTTFSYFILGDLGRDVWAIHNAHISSSVASKSMGSVKEMACHYIELILAAGITGPILLGGWSFGGYISLEMAHVVASNDSCELNVVGLIMMDSHYHGPSTSIDLNVSRQLTERSRSETLPGGHPGGLPETVKTSFETCDKLLQDWELPQWDGPTFKGDKLQLCNAENCWVLEHGNALHKSTERSWDVVEVETKAQLKSISQFINPPPTVAIHCVNSAAGDRKKHKAENLLGWAGVYPEFIKIVIDLDAEHYDLFDPNDEVKIDYLTQQIREAMEILGGMEQCS